MGRQDALVAPSEGLSPVKPPSRVICMTEAEKAPNILAGHAGSEAESQGVGIKNDVDL